ncbi:hypothetical protein GIB67_010605 [Kingdonia uniflora]|uniref:Phytocyanin domain-containing protein n=1 Tax=Kingdonia uniflora TaxID=39325 RepID=A0A7J7MAW9_9MAGN|nr:hypothetical protein GIB67_010605 [Kingdonia uniflora]
MCSSTLFVILTASLLLQQHIITAATNETTDSDPDTHVVLDNLGWIVSPSGAAAYRTWAASNEFDVGDILYFNFTTGRHDVAEVTKEAYDKCNTTNPISIKSTGPVNITIDSAGEHYFICTFTQHCSLGQKLAITARSEVPTGFVTRVSTSSLAAAIFSALVAIYLLH